MAPKFVVLKFGGTSVASQARWQSIAGVIRTRIDEGLSPVLVCSALAGVSNLLEGLLDRALVDEHRPVVDEIVQRHIALCEEMGIRNRMA